MIILPRSRDVIHSLLWRGSGYETMKIVLWRLIVKKAWTYKVIH